MSCFNFNLDLNLLVLYIFLCNSRKFVNMMVKNVGIFLVFVFKLKFDVGFGGVCS